VHTVTKTLSPLERALATQMRAAGLPEPVAQFEAVPGREFRWDFAWPGHKLLVEVNGGTWISGKHASGKVLTMRPGDDLITLQNTNNVAVLKDISDLLTMTIGASCSMPQGMLLQKRLGSYSAARGDELDADAHARYLLWNVKNWLCRPFFESWLEIKIATGEIDAPGFFLDPVTRNAWLAHEWQGPTRGHIDPTKMATFIEICKRMGICSNERAMSILFGADVSDEVQRLASETELYKDAGLESLLVQVQLAAEQAKAKGALHDHGGDDSEANEANDE